MVTGNKGVGDKVGIDKEMVMKLLGRQYKTQAVR
jgi:hypothetical protein